MGYFKVYKRIVPKSQWCVLANSSKMFNFPIMLISTVIEGVHQQRYLFARLAFFFTDVEKGVRTVISKFIYQMVIQKLSHNESKVLKFTPPIKGFISLFACWHLLQNILRLLEIIFHLIWIKPWFIWINRQKRIPRKGDVHWGIMKYEVQVFMP